MSSNVPINQHSDITAPTPQNTPLSHAPITAGLHRPTVPDITEDAEPGEDSTTVHEAMLGLVQGRLAGLLGKSSGYVENLPDGAKKTIEALKGVQVKQSELQNQYKRECLELEKKASHLYSQSFFFGLFYLIAHFLPPLSSLLPPDRMVNAVGSDHAVPPSWGGRQTIPPQPNRLRSRITKCHPVLTLICRYAAVIFPAHLLPTCTYPILLLPY